MNMRNLAVWGLIAALLIGMMMAMQGNAATAGAEEYSLTQIHEMAKKGEITELEIKHTRVTGTDSSGNEFFAEKLVYNDDFSNQMVELGVNVYEDPESGVGIGDILINIFPLLLFLFFGLYLMRSMQSGGGRGAMSFGKSRAKLLTEKHGRVTFDDVAGVDEAKEELQEVVDFLKDPAKFQRLGGKIPKGALLVGPPGTGKTLLARAVAGEAGVPFFTISGSDFVEMFVGVGASRVRDMFEQAKRNAPCIIFIDEIDAVGRSRGAGLGGGNDEREQTLNQLLVEMDGFESNDGIITVSYTHLTLPTTPYV